MDSKPASLRVLLGVIILIVVVVLAVAFLPWFSGVRSWLWSFMVPSYVESPFIGVEGEKGVLYTVNVFGVDTRTFGEYSLVDYARQGNVEVAILRSGTSYNVYDVSGKEMTALTNDGIEKSSIDLSKDGSQILFSVKARTLPRPTGAGEDDVVYQLPEWDVMIVDRTTKTATRLGAGNHAQFYGEGVFYPAPTGLIYRVPGDNGFDKSDEGSVLADAMAYRMVRIADLSEDGKLVFPSVLAGNYEAVVISSIAPLAIQAAPEHPIQVASGTKDVALRGNSIFVLGVRADGRLAVFKHSGSNVHPVYTFPQGKYPERFVRTY